jgi:hypothetical protein
MMCLTPCDIAFSPVGSGMQVNRYTLLDITSDYEFRHRTAPTDVDRRPPGIASA